MRNRIILKLCIFILLIPGIFALGSISTNKLIPEEVQLCGDYDQYSTLTASGIENQENLTLTSVEATLYISGESGLSFVSPQNINIGDLDPLSFYQNNISLPH